MGKTKVVVYRSSENKLVIYFLCNRSFINYLQLFKLDDVCISFVECFTLLTLHACKLVIYFNFFLLSIELLYENSIYFYSVLGYSERVGAISNMFKEIRYDKI